MLEMVIPVLIQLCIIALVVYIIFWVVETIIGQGIPSKVKQIVWVIFILYAILLLFRFVPH